MTRIIVPSSASEQWLGSELVTPPYKLTADPTWTAGSVSGSDMVLNLTNEGAGTPPNTGLAWPVGRHKITIRLANTLEVDLGSGADAGKVRVVSVGGGGAGSEVVSQPLTLWPGPNASPVREETSVLEFDSAGSTSYQVQVVETLTSAFDPVTVHSIAHAFTPYLQQNEQAHTEPDNGIVHKRDSSGNLLGVLSTQGEVPLMVKPGLTAIFIIPLDVPKAGYQEPESVKGRTVTITATGSPRYLG